VNPEQIGVEKQSISPYTGKDAPVDRIALFDGVQLRRRPLFCAPIGSVPASNLGSGLIRARSARRLESERIT
jgi:hypothetical protein